MSNANQPVIKRIVKQVLSGDSIIIREKPQGSLPDEKQVGLCWIVAPKMGRKQATKEEIPEEIGAFEAREFLRKKLIGKEVIFKQLYTIPLSTGVTRECGLVYLEEDESFNEKLVAEGLVEVFKRKQNEESPIYKRLLELEEKAKDGKKGKWAVTSTGEKMFQKRNVLQELSQETADYLRGKKFTEGAIVEYVQNADQMRIALLMDKESAKWQMITLKLSGVKCPTQKQTYGVESKFFVEDRLLQRDVTVEIVEMQRTGDNPILFGTVLGGQDGQSNIAIALLREGMATLFEATPKKVPSPQLYRQALNEAKMRRVRLWKDYQETTAKSENGVRGKEAYEGKVLEIINGDALNVLSFKDNQVKKIFLASIRQPRRPEAANDQKSRHLYDTPYMFEAREFLRKRLIGKVVQVIVDYVQPKVDQYPEKTGATVFLNDLNIGEALVAQGLATVIKYRADEERKSSAYDQLLEAELKAEKDKKGVHSDEKKKITINDLTNDVGKLNNYSQFLFKSGTGASRKEAIVEHVFSSTRIKLHIPKDNCLINLILQSINAPKANDGPYGKEGLELVKSLIHQRDVQVTMENMDKVGNCIGVCYYETTNGVYKNLALTLVEKGLASIRDSRDSSLIKAEEEARNSRKGIWKDWQPELDEDEFDDDEVDDDANDNDEDEKDPDKIDENNEKKIKKSDKLKDLEKRERVVVTEVSSDMSSFFVQNSEQGKALESLINELREDMEASPPLPGAYNPKKGDIIAAKFSLDNEWYRGKVEKINSQTKDVEILFIDYGNKEIVSARNIAPLPSSKYSINAFPAAAHCYRPAFVHIPNDLEYIQEAKTAFEMNIYGKELLMKKEFKETVGGASFEYVTLVDKDTQKDIFMNLVEEGYFMVKDNKRDRKNNRKNKLLNEYKTAQEVAKKNRLILWCYGDNTEDDANEFGYSRD